VLKIIFTLENDEMISYRAVKPILEGGVLVNKYIDSEEEFQILMESGGRLNSNIKKIRIEADHDNSGFEKNIRIVSTLYSCNKKLQSEESADSITMAKLLEGYNRYVPRLIDLAGYKVDSFTTWVENFKTHSQFIEVDGWAVRKKSDNYLMKVKAVLRSGDKVYELPSENHVRGDLMEYFARKDVNNAGFTSRCGKALLPAGDYQLGITLVSADSSEKWISYTDRHFSVHEN
ncbi:MAG TPA: hypothetical protein VE035_17535, partial [Puia sp.]|nr:hypothetical protein [Puia sp.]